MQILPLGLAALSANRICLLAVRVLPLQAINEKPSIINEYESGKAIPNGQLISKMERALGFLPLVSPYQRKHGA